jgi:UDP-2,3-diacylglucosamine hydrolase
MSSLEHGVVGILAGGGSLPREVAERVTARGGRVHVVTISDAADEGLASFPVTKADMGKVGTIIRAFRNAGCRKLVIVGPVRRPDLAAMWPDMGLILNLPAILRLVASGGDDDLLSRIVRFFEGNGFEVVAPAAVAPELLAGEGPLGRIAATLAQTADVNIGFDAVRAMGPYDVGQAVVVTNGRLEAVEGVEGTDGMLARLAERRRRGGGRQDDRSGVLVKRTKPGQELRIDLPAIGPDTIDHAIKAGLAGIAAEAGGVLAAERAELVRRADGGGLFVQGWKIEDRRSVAPAAVLEDWHATALGARSLDASHAADAAKGAGLLATLAGFGIGRCAIVDRGHVLAVECADGAEALIAGAGGIRQWGRHRRSRRSGVAVLGEASDLQPGLVNAAAAAGLAGLALVGQPPAAAEQAAIAEADRLGLAVVAFAAGRKGQHGRQ